MPREGEMPGKHTPGPWVFGNTRDGERLILGGPSRRYVATVTIHQIPRQFGLIDEPEREANARLIAIAPGLLKMLKKWRQYHGGTGGGGGCDSVDPEFRCELCNVTDELIAKAEGK